jgi:hypothetical protein
VKFEDVLKVIALSMPLLGGAYYVAVKSGVFINEARAEEIMQTKANEIAEKLNNESVAREKGDLKFQLKDALQELEPLLALEEPTEVQQMTIDLLKEDVTDIRKRLKQLGETP